MRKLGCLTVLAVAVIAIAMRVSDRKEEIVAERKAEEVARGYTEIASKKIPNGGKTRILLIAPEDRNEKFLRALGDRLKDEAARDRNAFIRVYANPEAAEVQKAQMDQAQVTEADDKASSMHFVAFYTKNGNTGHHTYTIALDGFGALKPTIEVKY